MLEKIKYELLTAATAGQVAQVIEKVYGESYQRLVLPAARAAWEAHQNRQELVALALAGDEAIAMVTLKQAKDSKKVYELGMLSVAKEYRKSEVANQLLRFATAQFAKMVEFDAVFMENVSTHYYSQRKALQQGAVDCAVAFAVMPEPADSNSRLSYAIAFFEGPSEPPQPIYIPQRYADTLLLCYEGLQARPIMPASYVKPEQQASAVQLYEYPTLQLARLSIRQIGSDLTNSVQESLAPFAGHTVLVYLPLSSPFASYAVSQLTQLGFYLAGVLPFWFGGDGLLMQRTRGQLAPMKLYSRKAKLLARLAKEDSARL